MKKIVLTGDFHNIGGRYGQACRGSITAFTKMIQVMRALSERPGAEVPCGAGRPRHGRLGISRI